MRTSPSMIALSMFLGLTACDLEKLGNQATARTVAVCTLLSTPSFTLPAQALAGVDAGSFDAGALLADAGVTVPAQHAAFVFFGQRQGDSLDVAPTGVAGASATLTESGGPTYALSDQGAGAYALPPDAGFVYRDSATYQFTFEQGGETYVAEVQRVPAKETIAEFHPSAGYVSLNANSSFAFTRPDPAQGQDRAFGFVNVFPISAQGQQGQPTYTNVPTTPLGFLKLVVAPSEWKTSTVTIPGSAFPQRDTNYVVVLQSAKLGGPKSSNLFTGSAILAGTADIAIVKTAP